MEKLSNFRPVDVVVNLDNMLRGVAVNWVDPCIDGTHKENTVFIIFSARQKWIRYDY